MNSILDAFIIDHLKKNAPVQLEALPDQSVVRVCVNSSHYQVFDGNLLLATFGSREAALQYAERLDLQ